MDYMKRIFNKKNNGEIMKKITAKKINASIDEIEELASSIEEVIAELQESLDNRTDKYRESEKGESAQEEIDKLQDLIDSLSYVGDYRIDD
jgi:archaellum component FlaC